MEADKLGNDIAILLAMHASVTPAEHRLGSKSCTIGRAESCQIRVTGKQISRLHARIEASGPRYILTDAGSVNGSYINGKRITGPHTLVDDDTIGLGSPTPLLRFLDPDATMQSSGALRYDEHSLTFILNGQELALSKTQQKLLLHLYRNLGSVCTRESCAEAIWSHDFAPGMDAGALDQALNSLRRALRDADPNTELIYTRRGKGYELVL